MLCTANLYRQTWLVDFVSRDRRWVEHAYVGLTNLKLHALISTVSSPEARIRVGLGQNYSWKLLSHSEQVVCNKYMIDCFAPS